jgi:uncharacterized protein (DUF1330 family)
MSHYFIAHIKINNPKEYQKYLDKAGDIFKIYKGKYLVSDDVPEILEGTWDYTRTVVIEFNNEQDFKFWYYSDEYQEILKYRLSAAECNTVLVKSLNKNNQ